MSRYQNNIFTKIIDGELPCHTVYEDAHVLAFLDIGPLSRGHTLVIPKEHAAHLHELSDESAAHLGRVLPRLCRAVMSTVGVEAYNVTLNTGSEAGQAVMHVHYHIIPKLPESGYKVAWNAGALEEDDARAIAAAVKTELARGA